MDRALPEGDFHLMTRIYDLNVGNSSPASLAEYCVTHHQDHSLQPSLACMYCCGRLPYEVP